LAQNTFNIIRFPLMISDPVNIHPPSFFGRKRRKKPVVCFQGGIHGGELTGTVAALHLLHVAETGKDLRGKEWPELQKLARRCRLLVVPWLNPDGVARWPLGNTSNLPWALYSRLLMGVADDGTPYRYPEAKAVFPIPPKSTAYMGAHISTTRA
jgi:hypothetical protein